MVGWWVSRPDFSRLLMSVGYGRGIEEDGRAGLCDAVLARLEMQLEHLADKLFPRSDSWPLQRFSARKQRQMPLVLLLLLLGRKGVASGNEAGGLLAC